MTCSTPHIRPAAVAGMFYPGSLTVLAHDLQQLLQDISPTAASSAKAIIAPHAGYVYSGPIAASVYAGLRGWCQSIRRVVLLGPTHRVAVNGLALPSTGFATPLGVIPVDQEAIAAIRHLPQVVVSDAGTAPNTRSRCSCPSCRRCWPSSRWCRSLSAMPRRHR